MTNVRAHVFIHGLVQGVFFRAHMQDEAIDFGVSGWVRNLQDGRVEAVLEGDEEAVRRLLKWCEKGPPAARVTDVKPTFEQYRGEFSGFNVL